MEAKKFKVIIVEDVKLELKGTEEIFRHEIPDAEVIGTAMTEQEFWSLMEAGVPFWRVRTSGSKCYTPCGACTGTAYS